MRTPRYQSLILIFAGVVVVSALGWVCLTMPFARGLERLSYDLPFAVRSNIATPELCLVTMDEKSARALGQPMDASWDRRLQTKLVRVLTEAGARAILFDLVFDTPGKDEATDEEFAEEIKTNGHVFLGGGLRSVPGREVDEEQVIPPIPVFRRAAAEWGLLVFRPVDPDYGVRRIYPGTEEVPSATWRMARQLGAPLPETADPTALPRWLNYYAPPGLFPTAGFQEALRPTELAPGFLQNRIVIVGGRKSLGSLSQQNDEFMTPYTRWGQPFAGGMEIHATTLLNQRDRVLGELALSDLV